MAYSQFNYKRTRSELGISEENVIFFTEITAIQPTDTLLNTLQRAKMIALFSEKARSEGIVLPILLEIHELNKNRFSVYSGAVLNADDSRQLNGECDFILSSGKQSFEIETPLFCLIEAEDHDIEKNIPQCIAQMEGARVYNEKEGKFLEVIFGCVTTGTEWQFLKLVGKTCLIDETRYYINDLPTLLGVLQNIIDIQTTNFLQ
jgi:hypothetical protein